ncbi:MAG: Glutamyl-tRNA reductase [Actinobacteria bacterium]|nr:Glutamyl-tRNA reductase [Actinomycetota bacterium]
MKNKVTIIGAGVVGTAIGYLLKERGYPVVGIASRTFESAKKAREFIGEGEASTDLTTVTKKADIIFITTPDSAIKEVCDRIVLEGGFNSGAIVFHRVKFENRTKNDIIFKWSDFEQNAQNV